MCARGRLPYFQVYGRTMFAPTIMCAIVCRGRRPRRPVRGLVYCLFGRIWSCGNRTSGPALPDGGHRFGRQARPYGNGRSCALRGNVGEHSICSRGPMQASAPTAVEATALVGAHSVRPQRGNLRKVLRANTVCPYISWI